MNPARPVIGIVGAGRVGGALARAWAAAGYRVGAVYSRTPAHAARLAAAVNTTVVPTAADVIAQADLTLLAVPDDTLGAVVASLTGGPLHRRAVIHASGVNDLTMLTPLAAAGAWMGGLHPALPVAHDGADALPPGAVYALEADNDTLRGWLLDLVEALGGVPLWVPPGHKALYHAALVLASNYMVTLYAIAHRLLTDEVGAEATTARAALGALLGGTLANLNTLGTPAALTGPIVRGDVGTVRAHLNALHADPAARHVYTVLARHTLPLAAARGTDTAALATLLAESE